MPPAAAVARGTDADIATAVDTLTQSYLAADDDSVRASRLREAIACLRAWESRQLRENSNPSLAGLPMTVGDTHMKRGLRAPADVTVPLEIAVLYRLAVGPVHPSWGVPKPLVDAVHLLWLEDEPVHSPPFILWGPRVVVHGPNLVVSGDDRLHARATRLFGSSAAIRGILASLQTDLALEQLPEPFVTIPRFRARVQAAGPPSDVLPPGDRLVQVDVFGTPTWPLSDLVHLLGRVLDHARTAGQLTLLQREVAGTLLRESDVVDDAAGASRHVPAVLTVPGSTDSVLLGVDPRGASTQTPAWLQVWRGDDAQGHVVPAPLSPEACYQISKKALEYYGDLQPAGQVGGPMKVDPHLLDWLTADFLELAGAAGDAVRPPATWSVAMTVSDAMRAAAVLADTLVLQDQFQPRVAALSAQADGMIHGPATVPNFVAGFMAAGVFAGVLRQPVSRSAADAFLARPDVKRDGRALLHRVLQPLLSGARLLCTPAVLPALKLVFQGKASYVAVLSAPPFQAAALFHRTATVVQVPTAADAQTVVAALPFQGTVLATGVVDLSMSPGGVAAPRAATVRAEELTVQCLDGAGQAAAFLGTAAAILGAAFHAIGVDAKWVVRVGPTWTAGFQQAAFLGWLEEWEFPVDVDAVDAADPTRGVSVSCAPSVTRGGFVLTVLRGDAPAARATHVVPVGPHATPTSVAAAIRDATLDVLESHLGPHWEIDSACKGMVTLLGEAVRTVRSV